MKLKFTLGRASAFTLVEALMGAAIAAIMFVGIFSAILTGNKVMLATNENLRATQIIESRMEGLRLIAWGTATNQLFNTNCVPATFTESYYPSGLGTQNNHGATYYGTITLQNPANLTPASTYSSQMCLVTVSLLWTNMKNSHIRTMSTYVAQNGLQNYVYFATNN